MTKMKRILIVIAMALTVTMATPALAASSPLMANINGIMFCGHCD